MGGSEPPSNTRSLGPTQVLNPNGTLIGSAIFAGLTSVTDRPTDHATRSLTIDRIYVRSTAMWSNNNITVITTAYKDTQTHHHTCTWQVPSLRQGPRLSYSLHSVLLQQHHLWTLQRNNQMQNWAQFDVRVSAVVQAKQGQHHTTVTNNDSHTINYHQISENFINNDT